MSDSIGARLRQAREIRHLTLLQASEATRVRAHYLQALESDDYSAIASAAQARGFLRIYAEFLGVDVGDLVHAVQAPPASAVPGEAALPDDPKGARLSLWDGLRQRLARRPAKGADVTPAHSDLSTKMEEQLAEQAPAQPAPIDEQTTRRTRAASQQVKKNTVR